MHPKRISLFVIVAVAVLAIWVGCVTAKTLPAPPTGLAAKYQVDPNAPAIAYWTAVLLGQYQYLQHPLDTELSIKFFDGYINALDPRHENFLQSDLDQFAVYRTNLDQLTTGGRHVADLTPAYAIYQRLTERLQQHNDYVNKLLAQDKFKFTTDEKIQIDRRKSPFPKDLDEAKALWKQRLRYEYLQEKLAAELHETNGVVTVNPPNGWQTNVVDTLTRRYRWSSRMMTNMDGDAILQVYLDALAHAYDPHSDYFSAPKAQDFSIEMSLSLFGIGARLGEDYGYCTIGDLIPGGPAAKSKQINPRDRIIAVAQGDQPPVDVVDMELEKVVQLIRGKKGTIVRLTVSPVTDYASRHVVTLVRDEIKVESGEAKAQLIELPNGKRLGVIDVPSFYAPIGMEGSAKKSYVSVDTAKLIKKLKSENVDGIILDLRSNPGGSLEEAAKFTGLFIKDGPVVLARDADGQVGTVSDPDSSVQYDGPLVVMVNRFSASASEIAAAALQDYGRALIVGDVSTHGKGTVQSLNQLRPVIWPATASATNDPGQLKITKGKFYRITGASTQLKGVASDIVLPDLLDHSPFVGEAALDNPMPWDTIQATTFNKLNRVEPYLAELSARSTARLATNQDFAYINQDIAEYEKRQADRSATINEADSIKQREQAVAQAKKRARELNNRAVPAVKIYDLTVENADDPGLPAPTSYFTTNTATADYQPYRRNAPVIYYSFDTNNTSFFALPETAPKISTQGTNVVFAWPDYSAIKLPEQSAPSALISPLTPTGNQPVAPVSLNGLDITNNTLIVTNPIVLDRNQPDASLEEAENILKDYIQLLSKDSLQVAVH
ncbi:MAG TPA: carboxy terminal-processing peptidase [Verrucomicrobiae bacterium]